MYARKRKHNERVPQRLLVVARISWRTQREQNRWEHDDAEVSRDPLWSRKLAYSLLHFLQRLSSSRFHARQLKSLINMQRELGKKKCTEGGGRYTDRGTKTRMKKGVPRKEQMNGWMKKLFWISYKRPVHIERLQLFSAYKLLIITRACIYSTFIVIKTWFN